MAPKRPQIPRRASSTHPPRPALKGAGSPSNPALDFAIKFEMLTDEEIAGCRQGTMRIVNNELVSTTGGTQWRWRKPLYKGRRIDLLVDRLLDTNPETPDD